MSNISERIALSEEVLAALPKTDEEQIKNYISQANKIYAAYNTERNDLIQEMRQRVTNFENAIKSDAVPNLNFDDLDYELDIVNPLNTPYEKLGLDEIFYHLSKYYRSNFEKVNGHIFEVLDIFAKVGVKLTKDDFYYNEFENLYMQEVLLITNRETANNALKPYFEEYYWKNPNIIRDIQLNFKSLYHQNIRTFNRYIENLQKEINKKPKQIIKEYHSRLVEGQQNLDRNKELQVKRFVDEELNIKDYHLANIQKISSEIIKGDILEYTRVIYNFNDTLREYKKYLKFKAVIDKVKETVKENLNKKERLEASKKLREIQKIERKLKNLLRRKKNGTDELIQEIKTLYDEYENIYHQEALHKYIDSESKISDVIWFFISYYAYYLQLAKIINDNREINKKGDDFKALKKLYLNPYVNLINNLDALKDYDIGTIILDKYKLDNLRLEHLSLDHETLTSLIEKTEVLCNYYKIVTIDGLDLKQIDDYIKLLAILNKLE